MTLINSDHSSLDQIHHAGKTFSLLLLEIIFHIVVLLADCKASGRPCVVIKNIYG